MVGTERGSNVPPNFKLDRTPISMVIPLLGDLVENSKDWNRYLRELANRYRTLVNREFFGRLIPVAIHPGNFYTDLGTQGLAWYKWSEGRETRNRRLKREIIYEFSRMLRSYLANDKSMSGQIEKERVFLSYSRHDDAGNEISKKVRDWISRDVQLDTFLDVASIPPGVPRDKALETGVQQSTLLAIMSDSYSSREWCRRKTLWAKSSHRPIVVAHCIKDIDLRSFPYIGNVPWIRVSSTETREIERIVGIVLHQLLRHFLWYCRTKEADEENPQSLFLARAPELLTLKNINRKGENVTELIYPDPSLGSSELELLEGNSIRILSFSEWLLQRASDEK